MELLNLYHVDLKNEKRGWETGFLISAKSDEHLRIKVKSLDLIGNTEDWSLTNFFYICKTPDEVEEEMHTG